MLALALTTSAVVLSYRTVRDITRARHSLATIARREEAERQVEQAWASHLISELETDLILEGAFSA